MASSLRFCFVIVIHLLVLLPSFTATPWQSQFEHIVPDLSGTLHGVTVLNSGSTKLLSSVGVSRPVNAAAFNNPILIPTTQSLTLATVEDAQRYVLYAAAAYCFGSTNLTTWTCNYCKALGTDIRLHTTLYNSTTKVVGMITVDDAAQEIVATFRGSYAPLNFVLDLNIPAVPFRRVNPKVLVHIGQLQSFESIYDQLLTNLKPISTQYPSYRLVFVGHSLGSNIATLALLKTAHEPEFSSRTYALFSYGGPRVGNPAFAQWVNAMNFTHARVVHFGDIAPHLYPDTLTYTHFGTEFWIDGLETNHTRICARNVTEDPTCSNSLAPTYELVQHLTYYDVQVLHCLARDPVHALPQVLNVVDPDLPSKKLRLLARSS